MPVNAAVEAVAREGYGRLVAWLTRRSGDVALAEDALADALERALETWPRDGVPDRPEAWLLTAARRRMVDGHRRATTRELGAVRLRIDAEEALHTPFTAGLPDRRVELLFLCAHPEVPQSMRTPLMLQVVLGLDAARIGSAFLVAPSTMAQRLVRVKRSLRDWGLSMELPPPDALAERLPSVLEAIYAAFSSAWDASGHGLAEEALWLARILVHTTRDPEALGLLSLISHSRARQAARLDDQGRFVPLSEQDPRDWDAGLLVEGEKALWMAAKHGRAGRFQLEASIQSHHADRLRSGRTDWASICAVYSVLVKLAPSIGAEVGYAGALLRQGEVGAALARLDSLPADRVRRYQPYWAVRTRILRAGGETLGAEECLALAVSLTVDPAVRTWLTSSS